MEATMDAPESQATFDFSKKLPPSFKERERNGKETQPRDSFTSLGISPLACHLLLLFVLAPLLFKGRESRTRLYRTSICLEHLLGAGEATDGKSPRVPFQKPYGQLHIQAQKKNQANWVTNTNIHPHLLYWQDINLRTWPCQISYRGLLFVQRIARHVSTVTVNVNIHLQSSFTDWRLYATEKNSNHN